MQQEKRTEAKFKEVAVLIKNGNLIQAQKVLNEAPFLKQHLAYYLQQAKIYKQSGALLKSLESLDTALDLFSNKVPALNHKVELLFQLKKFQEFESALLELRTILDNPFEKVRLEARAEAVQKNYNKAIASLECALDQKGILFDVKIGCMLFEFNCAISSFQKGLAYLKRALHIEPDLSFKSTVFLTAVVSQDPENHGEKICFEFVKDFPYNKNLLVAQCKLLLFTGKFSLIQEKIDKSKVEMDAKTLKRLSAILSVTNIELPMQIPSDSDALDVSQADFLTYLAAFGVHEARKKFAVVDESEKVKRYISFMESLPLIDHSFRKLVEGFPPDAHWVAASGKNSLGSVVVFTGGAGKVCGLPIAIFDQFLISMKLDAIYLKDSSRNFFMEGVPGLGTWSGDLYSNINALLPSKIRYCICSSGGSFGGLNSYASMNYTSCVFLSPYTHFATNNKSQHIALAYMRKKHQNAPNDFLEEFQHQAPKSPIHLIYGEKDSECMSQVKRLEHIQNVSIKEIPRTGHSLLFDLVVRNELLPLLRNTLGVVPAESADSR
jgi:tetratricopeptide (TPR) repeat protein